MQWHKNKIIVLVSGGLLVLILFVLVVTVNSKNVSILPLPEYQAVDTYILSENIFADNIPGTMIAKKIIAAGANLIILHNDPLTPEAEHQWLEELKFSPEESLKIKMITINHNSYWLRDFTPIPFLYKVRDLPAQLRLGDFIYRNISDLDDAVSYQLGLFLQLSVEHIPLHLDGGNFLTNGEDCFLTDYLSDQEDVNGKNSYKPTTFSDYFKSLLGCRNVVFFINPPHEHIDMWAKIISHDTILINEIDEKTVELANSLKYFDTSQLMELKSKLNAFAAQASQYLKVERLPMPLLENDMFRTYANAILLKNAALVPQYLKNYRAKIDYSDQPLLEYYEAKVKSIYEKYGYKVEFIDSDSLIAAGGALHCVTGQLPEVPLFR